MRGGKGVSLLVFCGLCFLLLLCLRPRILLQTRVGDLAEVG